MTYYDDHVIVVNAIDELRVKGKAVALERDPTE